MATPSERVPNPCLDRLLLLFWEHYLKEGPYSSLSGSDDQTVDNIQRTMRAYSETGSDRVKQKDHKTLGNKLISCLDPYQEFEGILSKAGFIGFYAFFLRPDHPGEPPFPAQDCITLQHCFRSESGGG